MIPGKAPPNPEDGVFYGDISLWSESLSSAWRGKDDNGNGNDEKGCRCTCHLDKQHEAFFSEPASSPRRFGPGLAPRNPKNSPL